MLRCCAAITCDDCARRALLASSPSKCPKCQTPLTPDELVPMEAMRKVVADWVHDQAVKRLGDLPALPATSLVITRDANGDSVVVTGDRSQGAGSAVEGDDSAGDRASVPPSSIVTGTTSVRCSIV